MALLPPFNSMARVLATFAALAALSAIVGLSLVPGTERPHVLKSGDWEHFVAYLGTAVLIASGLPALRPWRGPLLLVGLAACLEVVQIFVPGRSPGLGNWLSSSAGACLGAAAFHLLLQRRLAALGLAVVGAALLAGDWSGPAIARDSHGNATSWPAGSAGVVFDPDEMRPPAK